jgi:DNA replicative helicase MCM subunit Mcm2 (Cdc46/Mcm family)
MRQAHAKWSQNTFTCGIIWIYNLQPKQVNIKPRGKLSPKKALNHQLKWEKSLCSKPSLLQEQEEDEVVKMRNTPDLFNKIVDSICPTIFGHQEIKRAVLLRLATII